MCECKKEIEAKLLSRFKEQHPEGKDHELTLQGYSLIFGDEPYTCGYMVVEGTVKLPLKTKPTMKSKKIKQNMMFTYCPFCGEKYEAE